MQANPMMAGWGGYGALAAQNGPYQQTPDVRPSKGGPYYQTPDVRPINPKPPYTQTPDVRPQPPRRRPMGGGMNNAYNAWGSGYGALNDMALGQQQQAPVPNWRRGW